jgi:hypothetical protein
MTNEPFVTTHLAYLIRYDLIALIDDVLIIENDVILKIEIIYTTQILNIAN